MRDPDRRAARDRGENLYEGVACKACDGTSRYVSNNACRECNKANCITRYRRPGVARAQVEYQREKKYGLTKEAFDALWSGQSGNCDICRESLSMEFRGYAVDHCHANGHVRGLLCMQCNTALGLLKDSPERARSAADYLERTAAPKVH